MTSLRRSGGSGDGGGGSSGSGGGRPSSPCGAVRWGVSGGGKMWVQQRQHKALTPQQLREWYISRGGGGGSSGGRSAAVQLGVTGGGLPKLQRRPRETLSPQQLRIAAAALGASESGTLPGTAPAEALHTFTLDSGALCCFFRDSTTLTPLSAPVPVRLADPSGGPVVANSSTVLPCLAVLSGSQSGLHLPSFSTNLVSTTALQDAMVTTTTPGGSSLYTLATEPPQVAASAQVSASSQVAASCSCRLLLNRTLLWHHRLGHPSLPRLRSMHSPLLRAAPHSSSFTPTTAPLQTLHMDVWGPARIDGQGRERYFLLVVDDYTRYTTVFPLHSKSEVVDVLIPWKRTVRLQLRKRFGTDLPVLRLHSDRGGEFSSDLLRDSHRGEGILQWFTLPDSPQQNGIAERRIGLVMELNLWPRVSLPETSPTLCWMGQVGDASVFRVWGSHAFVRDTSADKLFARAIPSVFLGFVPDAPSRQFYHPTSRRVLPSQDVTFDESVPFYRLCPYCSAPPPPPPLFLAPSPPPVDPLPPQGPAPSGVSQVDPLPGTAPVQVAVGSGAAPGTASGGATPAGAGSQGAGSGGAKSEGAESGGAAPRGAASSGGPAGASPQLSLQQLREWLVRRAHRRSGAPGAGGAGDTRARGAAITAGAGGSGGAAATGPGGARTSGAGAAETGGVGCARAGDPTEPGAAGAGDAGAGGAGVGGPGGGGAKAAGAGVGGTGAGGAGAPGAGAVDPGTRGAGGTVRLRAYFVPLLQQVFGVPSSTKRRELASRPASPVRTGRSVPRPRPLPVPSTHAMALRPSFVPLRVSLPAPPESSLPEVPDLASDRAPAARPTISRLLATGVIDPSFDSAAASALVAELLDFAAACRLDYATALVAESVSANPPSVGGECALGTDVLKDRQEEFECLAAAVPRFASMLLAPEGDPDAPDIPTPRSYAKAITGPYSSPWQAAMDAEMASWKFTGTYVDEFPPSRVNIVDGMWIFRVKRPSGSPTALKHSFPAGQPARGDLAAPTTWFHWDVSCRTTLAALGFDPSTADPSLFLRTDTSLPPFYVLVYVVDLVFATTDTEALTLVNSELQRRHTYIDLGELHNYLGLHINPDRARRTITLTQSHMVYQVLQRFGFQFSSPQPTPLSTSHSLSAPPSDESVEPSGPYPELVGCLMCLMTCTQPDLAYPLSLLARSVAPGRHRKVHWDAAKRVLRYLCITSGMGLVFGGWGPVVLTGHANASWVDDSAMQRSSQGYTFSLGSSSVSWWSTHSSSVLSSSCEAEIYAEAMAAQELRWLTYLLADLGE
ncbi:unnamed protein product [Closterium sp. NIES-53]